jgi:hypothetical protein
LSFGGAVESFLTERFVNHITVIGRHCDVPWGGLNQPENSVSQPTTIDNPIAEAPPTPYPTKPHSRCLTWLASKRLWIVGLLLAFVAIAFSVVIPVRERLAALRYLNAREIEYELSPHDAWMTERFGEWAVLFRSVERIKAQGITEDDLLQIAHFTEAKRVHCGQYSPYEPVDERSVLALRSLTHVESLSLAGECFTDSALTEVLSARPPLSTMAIHGTQGGRNMLLALHECETLTTLIVNGRSPDDADFAVTLPPPHLKTLYLWGGQRGDQAARWASNAHELQSISILGGQITEEGLADLSRVKTLESVDLFQCPNVTAAGLEHLTALPNLRTLGLPGELVTAETLEILQRMPSLDTVNYSDSINPYLRAVVESQWPSSH